MSKILPTKFLLVKKMSLISYGAANDQDFQSSKVLEIRILYFINKMKPKTSYSNDLTSNNVLKSIEPYVIQPLKHFIKLSLKTGYFHDNFRIAKIISIQRF